jgi:hypothetical protein
MVSCRRFVGLRRLSSLSSLLGSCKVYVFRADLTAGGKSDGAIENEYSHLAQGEQAQWWPDFYFKSGIVSW